MTWWSELSATPGLVLARWAIRCRFVDRFAGLRVPSRVSRQRFSAPGAALPSDGSRWARFPAVAGTMVLEQGKGTGWIAWEPVRSHPVHADASRNRASGGPNGPGSGGSSLRPGALRRARTAEDRAEPGREPEATEMRGGKS